MSNYIDAIVRQSESRSTKHLDHWYEKSDETIKTHDVLSSTGHIGRHSYPNPTSSFVTTLPSRQSLSLYDSQILNLKSYDADLRRR